MKKLTMDELNRLSTEEFKNSEKLNAVILLDNVRSLNNVGSAFRTADAFAIEKIYLCGITGSPPNREINKTALGATETVDWEYSNCISDVILKLKDEGYVIIAVEQVDPSTQLTDFNPVPDGRYCFIFGNEVFGVSEEALPLVDFCIEIPQFGTKHSLNVSVSIGIIIWDFVSKSYKKKILKKR